MASRYWVTVNQFGADGELMESHSRGFDDQVEIEVLVASLQRQYPEAQVDLIDKSTPEE